jgi:inner membrane protein
VINHEVPSVGHLAVGLAANRVQPAPEGIRRWMWVGLLLTLALLPDADVVAFALGIPYSAPFGHRGATHSLAFAMVLTLFIAGTAATLALPVARIAVTCGIVLLTHGLLDTLTDGGLGIALLWPFSNHRYFAPWRPIPVAPIGLGMLSARGLSVTVAETLLFLPLWLVAAWPRRDLFRNKSIS